MGSWLLYQLSHLKAVSRFHNKGKPDPELFFLSFFKAKVDCVGNEPKFRLSIKNLNSN